MAYINCKHFVNGKCAIGKEGGSPTLSFCAQVCESRLPIFGQESTIKNSPIEHWGRMRRAEYFARSLASGKMKLKDDAEKKTFALRVLGCFGDNHATACESLGYNAKQKYHYCIACGCGQGKFVRLSEQGSTKDKPTVSESTKLGFRWLACPRKKEGFSNAASNK